LALRPNSVQSLALSTFLLGLWSMAAVAAMPEDGRRAYDAGHFTDAMGIWAQLSREGNAEAEFGLGLLYDLGNGTPQDPETAFVWYRLAAEAGMPEAEFNLGAMYDGGRGVARSGERAALWYAKAGAHGHHRAQFDLGLLYQQGDGLPRNPDAAAAWFRAAAEGGLPAAAARLKTLKTDLPGRDAMPPDTRIAAVTLAAPSKGTNLVITRDHPSVELVWIAPRQPKPVHYDVQVRELGGPVLRIVTTASVAETAAVIRLPPADGSYAWEVDTVAPDGSQVGSDWSWFSVGSGARLEQSMSSTGAPQTNH